MNVRNILINSFIILKSFVHLRILLSVNSICVNCDQSVFVRLVVDICIALVGILSVLQNLSYVVCKQYLSVVVGN